jgi:hypothetical protein
MRRGVFPVELLARYEAARAWHRVCRDYATDPALSEQERALWRRRQRVAGHRYGRLKRDVGEAGLLEAAA